MKKFFTTVMALLPLSTLIAQTFLHQEFGRSPLQVSEFLKTKKVVNAASLQENTIVASTEAYTITYRFDESGLYMIETISDFADRKDAIAKMECYKRQHQMQTTSVIDLNADEDMLRFVALTWEEIDEVSIHFVGKRGAQMRIVAVDLNHAPQTAINDLRNGDLLFTVAQR